MDKLSKEAQCIRNTATWAHVKPTHKFDSSKFNKNEVLNDLPIMSPKIHAMLNKIKELDAEDMNKDGKYYKHIIYSDVTGTNGAKMVASSMIANDYVLSYNNGKFLNDLPKTNKTFGLLTTTVINKKPMSVNLKKTIINTMNERPKNINGENMRFLILDSGFKEGIDVYDVKYMHILEPLITKAETTQVIGRGTRFCGQAGLPFIPNKGWALNVYRYNINYNDNMNVHELFIKHSNQNISALNFTADIEDIMAASSVDMPLTENIHTAIFKNNRFYNFINNLIDNNNKKGKYTKKKDLINVYSKIRGKIFTNEKKIDCKKKCKDVFEEYEDAAAILLTAAIFDVNNIEQEYLVKKGKKIMLKKYNDIYLTSGKLEKTLREKHAKTFLCNYLDKRKSFCDAVNKIWLRPIYMFKTYGKQILEHLEYYKKSKKITELNYSYVLNFIQKYSGKVTPNIIYPEPPIIKLKYLDLYDYIIKHYSAFKWNNLEIKNKCIDEDAEEGKNIEKKTDKNGDIITFSNTQLFVQNYLTPSSPFKGLLLYHSVGSGKTCSAIATATKSFDKENYTILWVTRHTLKEDIWKNMFEKICNIKIREMVANGDKIPRKKADKMALLGKNWLPPISYKQFTNLIKGKNKYYDEMVKRNGKEDPFKNTLVIIDEIHKIYSNTLAKLEKPDPKILSDMIQKSYTISQKNSVRLLLMTATPITEDPLSAIKILNLLLEGDDRFTEDFEEFKSSYCNENGLISDVGTLYIINKITGLISFIDRGADISQFAYPVINDVILNIKSNDGSLNKKKDEANERMIILDNAIEDLTQKIANKKEYTKEDLLLFKEELKQLKKERKILQKELKNIIILEKEPKNVIEHINNCFNKKSNIKNVKTNLL